MSGLVRVDFESLKEAIAHCTPAQLEELAKLLPVTRQAVHAELARVNVNELDASLRLYSRAQLAELANCDTSTVHRALADPRNPLRYTHVRGRRKYVEHSAAKAWLDSMRIDDGPDCW